ncbi:MAG: ATP-binding protein [Bryobacteraceae bacterium]
MTGARSPVTGNVRIGLAWKLAVCLAGSTAVIFSISGYLHLRQQRQQAEQLILISAERVSDLIRSSAQHMMLQNDREGMHSFIRNFGAEPGIRRVRLFNEEGRIQFSSEDGEVGTLVDKSAEQCYACHAQQAPLVHLNRPDRARIFTSVEGRRTLAVIRPIENKPECSDAACHAHPRSRRILGVIDAQLALDSVDDQLAAGQRRIEASTILALVAMLLISLVFIWVVLHKPIKDLMKGIHAVTRGDLQRRLPVRSSDELGELAGSFNQMASELDQAHNELTSWAKTLEERVQTKSAELENAYSSLVTSEKMASLGKLAATVAHEVNNPLFGMLTYARLGLKELDRGPIDEKPKAALTEYLRIIERESKRCGEIMKNLLAFARQSAPQRAMNDVNVLVERAATLIRHQLELNEIKYSVHLDASIPEVFCDAGQIQQVLLVLMANAAEAMQSGGSLAISTDWNAATRSVQLHVRDTGGGIPVDVQSQIFEPFFTTKENQHRTGLGLAIAKGILEQHAGSIAFLSTPGKGTEFTVSLPASAENQLLPAGVASAPAAAQKRDSS